MIDNLTNKLLLRLKRFNCLNLLQAKNLMKKSISASENVIFTFKMVKNAVYTEGVVMKSIFMVLMFMSAFSSYAQEDIRHRLILIGDAGEINAAQKKVISEAAKMVVKGKTTTLYLGDNIYPSGLGLPNSIDEKRTKEILQSQYVPMRAVGSSVYFLTGNHDWDKFGVHGLEKIKYLSQYIEEQKDTLLKVVPPNGCPDPVAIPLTKDLVVIAFDSEWWVYNFAKENPDSACSCHTNKDVIEQMGDLLYANREKMILLASHHPFASYGNHGGYFSLKDQIFPLTTLKSNLYVPLPIIGSLYAFIRSNAYHPEDINHPLYQTMISEITSVFYDFPNVVNVSGHEHTLQMIHQDSILQVVSGSAAKKSYVRKNRQVLYGKAENGFVVADELPNKSVRFNFYELHGESVQLAYTYIKPLIDYKRREKIEQKLEEIKEDTLDVAANAGFSKITNAHRFIFGDNYRAEWSTKTTLPVIKIAKFHGGLVPTQRGGGKQSRTLRLEDKKGNEWAIRSVNKYAESILPSNLRQTYAKDVVADAMSAQHPYSSLIVPVLAEAAGIPHSNPVIGLIAPDSTLRAYQKDFVNTVCLIEERDPAGKSVNTAKLFRELAKDNDNTIDTALFLRARLLDLFIGDWDRHDDQWRWVAKKNDKGKRYMPVPRDRDQVFHVMEGVLPNIIALPWFQPRLHDYDGKIKRVNAFFSNGSQLNARFLHQFSMEEWLKATHDFMALMTDDVIEKALKRLPPQSYKIRHEQLASQMKIRRGNMPKAMAEYYHFLNKTVDIETSNKNEFVELLDAPNKGLALKIYKISKERKIEQKLYDRVFYPDVTKEVRIFTEGGADSIHINNHSSIMVRVVGGSGANKYVFEHSEKKVNVYEKEENVKNLPSNSMMRVHIPNDASYTSYISNKANNAKVPGINVGYNVDDGILLGLNYKIINQGFLKSPASTVQFFSFSKALATEAYNFRYKGEWLGAFKTADFVLKGKALAPSSTQNFFGVGNNTPLDKGEDFPRYYRTRFNIFRLDPTVRWRKGPAATVSAGAFLEYYQFKAKDTIGRIVAHPSLIGSYDSMSITQGKIFTGLTFDLDFDNRDNRLFTTLGTRFLFKVQGGKGLTDNTRSYLQVTSELSVYQKLDGSGVITISNRFGGGFTLGRPTFYQSLFLGGHDNLLGYRQYRYAGAHSLYNNLELRLKLSQITSYILPGELGLTGFYDVGKVWVNGVQSKTWHQGLGGGVYFVPAQLAVFQFIMGHSKEGWYPYFTMGLRF